MTSDIRVTRRAATLELGFNRPARRNALTNAMYDALTEALLAAEQDAGVRAIVFHGDEQAFTAGNDLADFLERPPQGEDAPVFRFIQAVLAGGKPLVAAANGNAVGIGTTLLLHCDLVYAGENARFSLPFASLGLLPEFASSYVLPRLAGHHRAAEMLLLGETFGPAQAMAAGFVNRVLPPGETLEAARAAADRLSALPEKSVRLTRALLRAAERDPVIARARDEARHFREMLGEPPAREAMAKFLGKKKPT